MGIGLDGSNELLYVATLHGLSRQRIHFAGILVGRIVGEVAADDKEIALCEIRLQHLSHPFKFPEIVGRDDDGHDGRHVTKTALQERQLHLQTVLPIVSFLAIGEDAVGLCQLLCRLVVYLHLA